LSVTVPAKAVAGVLYVRDRAGRRSNAGRPLRVVRPSPPPASAAASSAFDGNGMWIWYVSKSSGGDPQAIVDQARAHGITTVFVKSSDGTTWWSQFSPELVAALKAGGLRVCAWQYVYADPPADEIVRFRQLVAADGSSGLSWWSWQAASPAGWDAIAQPLGTLAPPEPARDTASYGPGGKGDPVIWAQEHLNGAGAGLV